MRWPNGSVTRPNISSPFGPRKAPIAGASTIHKGCDFTGVGQIKAVADGTVVVVGTPAGWSGGGKQVWIQHDGYFSKSMHMGSFAVSVGQRVSMAQFIGTQDTTGTATGSHVHLEISRGQWNGSNSGQIDPVPFIQARLGGNTATSGNSGTAQLQLDLSTLGIPTDVDGVYGPGTKASVTTYQRANPPLAVDGDAGPATLAEVKKDILALQNDLRSIGYTITADGQSGPQTVGAVKDFQGKNGLTVDGMVGPNTRAKLNEKKNQDVGYNAIPNERSTVDVQRLVGANPDGVWGPETTAKVKTWQSAHGLTADGIWGAASDAKGFPPTPAAYIPIDVDGSWGKATTTALQANLGLIPFLSADQIGVLNVTTIKALQKAIGIPEKDQDGIKGTQTVKYMQSSLGVRIDGQEGPETIKALQSLLNRSGKLLPVPFDDVVEPPVKQPKPAAPTYPGAEKWDHSVNSSKRTGRVQLLIVHHWGTNPIPTPQATWDRFMRPNENSVSPNWQVNTDGSAWEVVPPDEWRAWTTGAIDMQAVTIETQNSTVGPTWGISPQALERIAQILAWASKRYNFPIQMGEVGPDNVVIKPGLVGHNMTPAGKQSGTVCPGPSMAEAYDWILMRAKAINAPVVPPIDPPIDPPVDTITKAELSDAWDEYIDASETFAKVIDGFLAQP